MKEQVKKYFDRYVSFEPDEFDQFYSCLTPKTFRKKEYLLQEGEICKHSFFITQGLTRSFYLDEKGSEQILQFGIENWWISNTESFVKEVPSHLFIQALEDTSVLMIARPELERLYLQIPKLERLFRMITENMLIALQRRDGYFMKMNSKKRYENIVRSFPDFVQRVPQYMIASYLEITPEYLSELRKLK